MDKYRRVEKPRRDEQTLQVEPNEIRITQQGKVRSYISYAHGLFAEKNERCVVLKAMGNAISKAVTVAEILKHRVAELHMVTRISSIETVDVYDPLEEGLDRIETKRKIPSISIQLSLDQLDRDDPGYQSPIPADQVSASSPTYHDTREFRKSRGHRRHSGRQSGRGGKKSEATSEAVETVEAAVDEQQTPREEGEAGSTPTTRGKRGKGRGRKQSGSNGGPAKKDSGRASPEEGDDNAAASNGTEQQAEGEAQPSISRNRKSGRGRKVSSNGKDDKQEGDEGDEAARETEPANGRSGKGKHFGRNRGQRRSRKGGESNQRDGNSGSPTITTDSATVDAAKQ